MPAESHLDTHTCPDCLKQLPQNPRFYHPLAEVLVAYIDCSVSLYSSLQILEFFCLFFLSYIVIYIFVCFFFHFIASSRGQQHLNNKIVAVPFSQPPKMRHMRGLLRLLRHPVSLLHRIPQALRRAAAMQGCRPFECLSVAVHIAFP